MIPADDPLMTTVHARSGHFRLESGHHSDLWLDLETLFLQPARVERFTRELAEKLRTAAVDVVCGPLNEGAFAALMVASALGCEFAYAERFERQDVRMFPVEYRVPRTLHPALRGKRVAIVNDVTSAGSAVRGTFADVRSIGGTVVAIGSLIVLGDAIESFAREQQVTVASLRHLPHNLWVPEECPLCSEGAAMGGA